MRTVTVLFGLTVFFSLYVPSEFIAARFTDWFAPYPHFVYLIFALLINTIVPLIIAWLFYTQLELKSRLPIELPKPDLFWLGGIVYLLPQLANIIGAATTEDGLAETIVSYRPTLFWLARLLLGVGVIRLLLAVRPSSKYKFPD